MKRKIVQIDEEKCNGCGLCASACHESAIEIIDGKARLLNDKYCDGLGDCLPACPTGAIEIIEREAEDYDERAVEALKSKKTVKNDSGQKLPCGCPGSMSRKIEKAAVADKPNETSCSHKQVDSRPSELSNWPVQLKLVNPHADYFDNADILVAADCTAFSYGDFHRDFIGGKITLIGCPKLDDSRFYVEKLAEIFKHNNINSITVVSMQIPCCEGIKHIVREAMLEAKTIVPYKEITIGLDGNII